MTRKRIKHKQIPNESKRNVVYKNRVDGLLKKANDLSILCGVEVGVIVHKQEQENNSILWPSPEVFKERLDKFTDFSNLESTKKMVLHESYMEHTVNEETKNLLKSKKRIEQKGSQQLLNELIRGKDFEEINLDQLKGLNIFANEMLKKLQKRDKELNDEQRVQILPCPFPPPQLPAQPPHDNDPAP